jgi:hypothetical protein
MKQFVTIQNNTFVAFRIWVAVNPRILYQASLLHRPMLSYMPLSSITGMPSSSFLVGRFKLNFFTVH